MLSEMMQNPFWDMSIWGNQLWQYGMALFTTIVLFGFIRAVQATFTDKFKRMSEKSHHVFYTMLTNIVKSFSGLVVLIMCLYIGTRWLNLNNEWQTVLRGLLLFGIIYQISASLNYVINYVVKKYTEVKVTASPIQLIKLLIKIVLWTLGLLLVLQNIGVNITSLVTGLGIGGIAVALAIQNILGDLLSSFAIFFDKPFEPGDFIIVDKDMGTVKKIGMKTTRLKTVDGEELIIPNKDITSSRVHNYKRMRRRRILFSFGVTYETPVTKVKKIPEMVAEIVKPIRDAELSRVHFKSLDNSALTFEVVYFLDDTDYTLYMDIQQEINVKLMEVFAKEKIEFAYPTQTVHVTK